MRNRRIQALGVAFVAALAAAPLLGTGNYWLYTLTVAFYYSILAASWSLLAGYVGQISFAQAAMSGLGAYASGLLVSRLDLPVIAGLGVGAAAATLIGLGLGWICLRLKGAYLGLTTIAFSEILRITITAEYAVTRGSLGLQVPPLLPGASPSTYFYVFLAASMVVLALLWVILKSRIGIFFRAIREDEDGAASLGVNVTLWKVVGFAISSGIAGFGGALYVHFVRLIAPSAMSLQEMGLILSMAVIGGIKNVFHAAVGAILIYAALEMLRNIGDWRLAIFALLVILILRFAPDGVLPILSNWLQSRRSGSRRPRELSNDNPNSAQA